MPPRVTAADVAARAGASRSAVSLVLNGRADGNVSSSLQESIRRAVRELEYVPQNVGRSLRSRSTRTIGVITDEIVTSPFAGGIISGAGAVARENGFMLMVADTEGREERIHEIVQVFLSRSVDALVLATGGLVRLTAPESFRAMPSVLANCIDPAERSPAVIADEAGGSALAVQHLAEQGHQQLTLLSGTEDSPATPLRRDGFLSAAGAAGVEAKVVACGWEIGDGYRAAAELFASERRPTAVVASNDRTAVGVLLAAAHHGMKVPEELSVVGVDDQPHLASQVVPALTTVALPHRQIGELAMEEVFRQLSAVETASPSMVKTVDTRLITRESTGPAPSR